jgi:hypothetical protein
LARIFPAWIAGIRALGTPERGLLAVFLCRGISRSIFTFRTGFCRDAKTRFRKPVSLTLFQLTLAHSTLFQPRFRRTGNFGWSAVEVAGV